jgi:hypothetical protein
MFDDSGKQVSGCSLKFDTCLGINDKEILNQMQIVGEAQIIFTSGATIVVKDIQFKTQTVLSNEGKLRNVTALYSALDKNRQLVITAGESSLNHETPIAITIIFTKDNKWVDLPCNNIYGTVKSVMTIHDKKFTYALIISSQGCPWIYMWNFRRDKLIASKELKISIEKFSPHPAKHRTVLLFSSSYLRLFEVVPQSKTFQESQPSLVSSRVEREAKF